MRELSDFWHESSGFASVDLIVDHGHQWQIARPACIVTLLISRDILWTQDIHQTKYNAECNRHRHPPHDSLVGYVVKLRTPRLNLDQTSVFDLRPLCRESTDSVNPRAGCTTVRCLRIVELSLSITTVLDLVRVHATETAASS